MGEPALNATRASPLLEELANRCGRCHRTRAAPPFAPTAAIERAGRRYVGTVHPRGVVRWHLAIYHHRPTRLMLRELRNLRELMGWEVL